MVVYQVVQLRYNSMKAIKRELDKLFPGQEWSIEVCASPLPLQAILHL
jgi:hypothetical protein